MKTAKISIARLNAQRASANVRNITLEPGEKLHFLAYTEAPDRNNPERPQDSVLYNSDQRGTLRFSIAEFHKLKLESGNAVTAQVEGEEFVFPSEITIKGSNNRMNALGEVMFPLPKYSGYKEYLQSINNGVNSLEAYNKLIETSVVEGATPVQDYTVAVK